MRRTNLLIGTMMLALAAIAPGAGRAADDAKDAEPKSAAAKAALRKYEKSIEKAQQAYTREAGAAQKAAAAELAVALKAATRAANLDEANRIKASIDALAADAPAAGATARNDGTEKLPTGKWEVSFVTGNRQVFEFDGRGARG